MIEAISQFSNAISQAGLAPPETIQADGTLHRFPTDGKHGDDSGWYVFHPDGVPAGTFGCWRSDIKQNWRADIGRKLADEETKAHRAKVAVMRKARENEERRGHLAAAEKAAKMWEEAEPATEDQPYLKRKGVPPNGTRVHSDGRLLIPMRDISGKLWNLERISPDGTGKKGLYRGKRQGCFFGIGKGGDVALVCEGYATGASLHEATGFPVAVAFNCSNLKPVSKAIRRKFPDMPFLFCADDDYRTGEPGRKKAEEAAKAVGGLVVLPDFGTERPEGATDFNDLHQAQGLDAVKAQVESVIETEVQAMEERGKAAVIEDRMDEHGGDVPDGWSLTKKMVFEVKEKADDTEYVPVCGPLRVLGRTNGAHGEWGLMLSFVDHDGREQRRAIPATRLHEDPGILARELATAGLKIIPGKEKRMLSYLAEWDVDTRTGALSFVMPDRVISRNGTGAVVFQPERFSPTARTVHASGTLDDWQRRIATPACDHPLMLFALCAGLAPVFLAFAEASDSFIVHLWGTTSKGKTTLVQIAVSPWGCAADPNDAPSLAFLRRWNVTGNGLEGLAEAHSDLPLGLDELGSATVGDVRPLVYQVAGGRGNPR